MHYKTLAMTLLLGMSLHTGLVQAAEVIHHEGQAGQEGRDEGAQIEMVMTKGVITRIDEANNKVGIKHEEIENLNMPAMTMSFILADPAMIKGFKVGDAVTFHAENPEGKLTLTMLQKQ